jgi:uncharacterized protein
MTRIAYIIALTLATFLAYAQMDDFDRDIEQFLRINGSSAAFDIAVDQMVSQFKMMKSDAPDAVWTDLRDQVFDREIEALYKLLIPLYKKHFTHPEIKSLIEFYRSPLGEKVTGTLGMITHESLAISQNWAMGLGMKITEFLQQKGY